MNRSKITPAKETTPVEDENAEDSDNFTDDEETDHPFGMTANLRVFDRLTIPKEELEKLPKSVRSFLLLAKMEGFGGLVREDMELTKAEFVLIETLLNKMGVKKIADEDMKWSLKDYGIKATVYYPRPPPVGENLYEDEYEIEECLSDLEVANLIFLLSKLKDPSLTYDSIGKCAKVLSDLDSSHYAHRLLRIMTVKLKWITRTKSRYGTEPPKPTIAFPWGRQSDIWLNSQSMFDHIFIHNHNSLHLHASRFLLALKEHLDPPAKKK